MMLGIFERLNCSAPEGFEHVHGVVESTKQAFVIRNRSIAWSFSAKSPPHA
jgi:gamma-glutamyltranspeptidase/glutathione hydrolase